MEIFIALGMLLAVLLFVVLVLLVLYAIYQAATKTLVAGIVFGVAVLDVLVHVF
jgi:hypothetical protein